MSLGGTCPTCGQEGYDYAPMEYADEGIATERVTCEDGHAWINTWRLDSTRKVESCTCGHEYDPDDAGDRPEPCGECTDRCEGNGHEHTEARP